MTERRIELSEDIDPIVYYGVNDVHVHCFVIYIQTSKYKLAEQQSKCRAMRLTLKSCRP